MTAPKPYTYHLTYLLTPHKDGIGRDDIPNGHGAADAAVIISLLYPDSGEYSAKYMSRDGRTGQPLGSDELFKAWICWAATLAQDPHLNATKREFAGVTWTDFSAAIREASERARMRHAAQADKKEAMLAVLGLARRMRARRIADLKLAIEEGKNIRKNMIEAPSLSSKAIDKQIVGWINQLSDLEREDEESA